MDIGDIIQRVESWTFLWKAVGEGAFVLLVGVWLRQRMIEVAYRKIVAWIQANLKAGVSTAVRYSYEDFRAEFHDMRGWRFRAGLKCAAKRRQCFRDPRNGDVLIGLSIPAITQEVTGHIQLQSYRRDSTLRSSMSLR